MPATSRSARRAFTLVEVMVVLLIATVLMAGLLLPVTAQVQLRRQEEARRVLEESREALLGFAAAHGRLPCPAGPASRGQESFAPGGSAADGRCEHFFDGFLPAAALGLAPLDSEGFSRDPWGSPGNRLRYAVYGNAAINGIADPLTRTNGMQAATLAGLAAAPGLIAVCASGRGATASGCGGATNHLTRRAAFIVLSAGPNAHSPPGAGSDEARNLEGRPVFVFRGPSDDPGDPFDDLLTWSSIHVLAARLLAAGRLP